MKPGIIAGNLITLAAGFFLASKGDINLLLFFQTLLGLMFIIASACICNNYIDRIVDSKMQRTQPRAKALQTIGVTTALSSAAILALSGNIIILISSNILTACTANIGFLIYVFIYSFLKTKTTYSTLIGSVAGAIPPLVGYCAVSNQLDTAAAIFFLIMIFWQMPHFFAIALWYYDDYRMAGIPVLPVVEGIHTTKVQMFVYILSLIPILSLFTLLGYTGTSFLLATSSVSVAWLFLSIRGFHAPCNKTWGKQMFHLSLVLIMTICVVLPLDLRF